MNKPPVIIIITVIVALFLAAPPIILIYKYGFAAGAISVNTVFEGDSPVAKCWFAVRDPNGLGMQARIWNFTLAGLGECERLHEICISEVRCDDMGAGCPIQQMNDISCVWYEPTGKYDASCSCVIR